MYELTIKSTKKKYQFETLEELTEAFPYKEIQVNWYTLYAWFAEKEKPFDNGIVKIEKIK